MKRNYFLLGFLVCAHFAFAQTNVLNTTGNVGIGTTSPQYNLEIHGDLPFLKIRSSIYSNSPAVLTVKGGIMFNQENVDKTAAILEAVPPGYHVPGILFSTKTAWNDPGSGATDWYHRMFIHPNGNIGVGNTAPTAKLDISGSVAIQSSLTNASARPAMSSLKIPGEIRAYSLTNYQADDGFLRLSAGAGTNPMVQSFIDLTGYSTIPDMNMNIVLGTNGTERIRILNSGNVGIGTAFPAEKLSVKGKIRAQEIKVETNGWSDFVFAKDYVLPTLEETERHIREKGHLEGIPSALEVEKNGIEVGEMNKKLLQKIEELTLYLIEMKKENASLERRVVDLEAKKKQ